MPSQAQFRIAHVTPTYFSSESVLGGGERYVDYIARSVKAASTTLDQVVISTGETGQTLDRNGIGIKVLVDNSGSKHPMDSQPDALWQELRNVDLVHIHQSLTRFGAFALVVAKTLRKPVVLTDLGGGHEPIMLRGGGLELGDAVVSISQYAASLIAPYYNGRHEVILGPVDTDHFAPRSADLAPKHGPILSVGRILPHKGVDKIIEALPDGVHLNVVGNVYNKDYFNYLVQIAKNKAVSFLQGINDVKLGELYNDAGLFVQASTYRDVYGNIIGKPELLGLTTLEALSSGLPIVVSSAGSLPELATDPQVSAVFRTTQELRSILERFRDGLWPVANARHVARDLAVRTYSMQAVSQRVESLYLELLQNGRS